MSVATSLAGRRRAPAYRGWIRGVAAGAILLVAVNGGLYLAAPDLFHVDLAKGPYTIANNLELTRVYHRAIPLYEKIVEDFPDSEYAILARIGIANSHIGLGRARDALTQYELLLGELSDHPGFERHRYSILSQMAGIYRDLSDVDGHARVFAELEEAYPDSDAVVQERAYLATLATATANDEAPELPGDFPFAIDRDRVILPTAVSVGESFEVAVPIEPASSPTGSFSLMTSLGFWNGFRVERITPTPTSVAEFWGRRQWQFKGIDSTTTITAVLKATTAGSYAFDLDLENNYDIVELGIVRNIEVKE